MVDYLDEELTEVLVNDMVEFYNTYITMKSLTMTSFDVENVDDKTIHVYIGNQIGYNGKRLVSAKIYRESRTRVSFHFLFTKDEIEWAMKLYHMVDGYTYINLTNTNQVSIHFTLDLGSKQYCIDSFRNLQM